MAAPVTPLDIGPCDTPSRRFGSRPERYGSQALEKPSRPWATVKVLCGPSTARSRSRFAASAATTPNELCNSPNRGLENASGI